MPLWYSSVTEEHQAVRAAAGMFDCTHMGVLEATGPDAFGFLNTVFTNDLSKVDIGGAQYGYVIDAAGNVLDDIIIYRRDTEKYMVVVNAANEPKIKAYFKALLAGDQITDADDPQSKIKYTPAIRDMRDVTTGDDCRCDIALQGPKSIDIILDMVDDDNAKPAIKALTSFQFVETTIDGIDCIVSTTGYTGAAVSFELYAHPLKASAIWQKVLQTGQAYGVKPCGLGARDSLRIEAGFPLYGHELAGPYAVSPFQAGYKFAVKLEKDFFIGKAPMQTESQQYNMVAKRVEFDGKKGVRPARMHDAVLDSQGDCQGWVLSCAKVGEKQIAIALLSKGAFKEGDDIGLYYAARNAGQIAKGRKEKIEKNEKLQADIPGKVLKRFAKF